MRIIVIGYLLSCLFGCGQEKAVSLILNDENYTNKETESAQMIKLKGMLDFRPIKWGKNFKSWNGIEFFLTNKTAQSVNLAPSDSVTRDLLSSFDGKEVEITGYWYVSPAPDEGAYPVNTDGKPLKKSKRLKVTNIQELSRSESIFADDEKKVAKQEIR